MRERDVEAYAKKRVKAMGGEIRKVKWVGRRDAPDRFIMLPGRSPIWVEFKAPGQRPRGSQLREHARMRAFGVSVYVVDSLSAVEKMLS